MFKSKGVIAGVAATLVASTLLLAGLTISTTTGAATDGFGGAPSGSFDVTDPGSPPASPVEQPTTPDNGTGTGSLPTSPNPSGAPAGTSGAPGSLPSAGFGDTGSNSVATFITLLGVAGVAMIGAGATVVTANRRK